jgi:hypothetical protein
VPHAGQGGGKALVVEHADAVHPHVGGLVVGAAVGAASWLPC